MFKRDLFNADHEAFRDTVRRFIDQEIAPHHERWEHEGLVPRELWLKAGAAGLLCCTVPEAYGGAGLDYLFDVVVFLLLRFLRESLVHAVGQLRCNASF